MMTKTFISGACALAAMLMVAPVSAQEAEPDSPGLMQRGAEMFLRGLMNEMEPSLREMESALKDVQPEIRKLLAMVDDLRNYETPEKLPNGDILIRRKPGAPASPVPPGTPPKEGEIEL